jgi:nicotinamidase-related amidase
MEDVLETAGEQEEQPNSNQSKTELELDWEALAVAFENQLPRSHSFLDLTSGKVVTLTGSDEIPDPPDQADHFLYLKPRPSREGYRTMQNFIHTLDDPVLIEKLSATLVGKGAFRRFKDQLLGYPHVRQEWFAFKDAEVYAYASAWLEKEGVRATNEIPVTARCESSPDMPPPAARLRREMVAAMPSPETDCIENGDLAAAIAPFDRPGLMFRPASSALLVIDMQRVFVDPQGSSFLPMSVAAGEHLVTVIDACRRAAVPVIFTRHVHEYPERDGGAMSRWWRSLVVAGSVDSELAERFQPLENEPVVSKCRYDAFAGTRLEMILRSGGICDLLIGGVMTNLCCETTAREAFVRDFNVFFLGDCTAASDPALHIASLKNIAYGFGRVLGSAEAVGILERATVGSGY